jgi:hypothetical protein
MYDNFEPLDSMIKRCEFLTDKEKEYFSKLYTESLLSGLTWLQARQLVLDRINYVKIKCSGR